MTFYFSLKKLFFEEKKRKEKQKEREKERKGGYYLI